MVAGIILWQISSVKEKVNLMNSKKVTISLWVIIALTILLLACTHTAPVPFEEGDIVKPLNGCVEGRLDGVDC